MDGWFPYQDHIFYQVEVNTATQTVWIVVGRQRCDNLVPSTPGSC